MRNWKLGNLGNGKGISTVPFDWKCHLLWFVYFPVSSQRTARILAEDIVNFYCTTIQPVLEYSAQIFHNALPTYVSDDIERVQRRALSIVSLELSFLDSLNRHGLASLYDRRVKLCGNLFLTISNPCHRLSCLPPERHQAAYNTRRQRVFYIPQLRTNRFKHSLFRLCASVQI